MASLANKVAVVTGGSGTVGSGIIYQLLNAGAKVVAPVRSERSKQSLLSELADLSSSKNLETPVADISDPTSAEALAATVKDKYGGIDHVVTSVGSWWQKGPLLQFAGLQESYDEMVTQYKTYVLPHYVMAKVFLPIVKPAPESSFTFITGAAGVKLVLDASMIRAQVGALICVIDCVQGEYAQKSTPRVNEFRISTLIKRDTEASGPDDISNRTLGKYLFTSVLETETKGAVVEVGEQELKSVQK